MNKDMYFPLGLYACLIAGIAFVVGHAMGYDSATQVDRVNTEQMLYQHDQRIQYDCINNNGFQMDDQTYLCQPILPQE